MIHEILGQSLCPGEVAGFFPELFLALMFQVSFSVDLTNKEVLILSKDNQQDQLTPIRCSTPVLSSLLATRNQARGPGGS